MNTGVLQHWLQRIKASAMLYGTIGAALRVGSNLVILPLILTYLTPPEQALWWVFLALGGFANLADFGFGQVIGRIYSYLWAGADDFQSEGLRPPTGRHEPNLPRIRELNATSRALYFWLSLGSCVVLGAIGSVFLIKPIGFLPHQPYVWGLWVVYLLIVGYNLATSHWGIASSGTNRVREMHIATVWSNLSYFIVVSILLCARTGLASMVIASALRALILRQMTRSAYLQAVPNLDDKPVAPNRDMLKRLWPNAWKFGIQLLGGYLIMNSGVLVCSQFLPEVTASYGLTVQIGGFVMSLSVMWLGVKWPQLAMFRSQGKLEEMSVLFARRLGLVMASYAVLALVVLALGNYLLALKGTSTRLIPSSCLVVFFACSAFQTFYAQWGGLAMLDNTVPFFRITLFAGICLLTMSLILTHFFGLWGLVLAPVITEPICSASFIIRRGYASQTLRVYKFIQAAFTGRA